MTSTPESAPARRAADDRGGVPARRFGDALRVADAAVAERIVDDALAAGMAPEAIQSLVIAPAMVRIGELWEAGAIGVADEHLASSITQRAMIQLFAALSAGHIRQRSRERVMLAAVEGQRHVLGLRMVADVLEGAGFDVLYLGEDVPVQSLLESVTQHRPAVVGLGFGIASDVSSLADSVAAIHELAPETRIMLGGRAVPPGLRTVGYPFIANSMEVVSIVEDLLRGPPQTLPAVIDLLRSDGGPRTWLREQAVQTDAIAERLATSADEAIEVAREHVRRAERYRDLAFSDPLTELANRRGFEEQMSALTRDPAGHGAVLMIDVDAFKAVNDELGHAAGDLLLRAIGHAISDSVRPQDTPARVGGDEFAVLLPGATAELAHTVATRIRAAVARGAQPPVSISVGVALISSDARGALLAADTALYEAKRAGRDRVVAATERQREPKPGSDLTRLDVPPGDPG